jgi:hypothetical protein
MFWVVIGLLFLGIVGASVLIARSLKPKGDPMSRHEKMNALKASDRKSVV